MPSEKDTRRQQRSAEEEEEVERLHAEMDRLVRRLAELEPDDVCTVPLALDTEVARLMSAQARLWDVPLSRVYHSAIVHGLYHGAVEDGDHAVASDVARLIERLGPPDVWQGFLLQHPQEWQRFIERHPQEQGR